MPTTTSIEQSLINDTEFLDELGQFRRTKSGSAPVQPWRARRSVSTTAFDALDSGLAMDPDRARPGRRTSSPPPIVDPRVPANLPAPEERSISFMTAALVLLACLTAGAVTAAYVFQDRLTPVTARPSATR